MRLHLPSVHAALSHHWRTEVLLHDVQRCRYESDVTMALKLRYSTYFYGYKPEIKRWEWPPVCRHSILSTVCSMVWKPDKSLVWVYHADKTVCSVPLVETHSTVSTYKTRRIISIQRKPQATSRFAIYYNQNRKLLFYLECSNAARYFATDKTFYE